MRIFSYGFVGRPAAVASPPIVAVAATVVVAVLLVAACPMAQASRTPPIELQLITPWAGSHLLLEILESVAVENKTAFFPLLTDLTSTAFSTEFDTPKAFYYGALNVVSEKSYLSTLGSLPITKVALSLHATAPAIQAYYHYYDNAILPAKLNATAEGAAPFDETCAIWAELDNRQACTVASLAGLLDNTSPAAAHSVRLLPFDHILRPIPTATGAQSPVVILYADITSASFLPFHEYLSQKVDSDGITYVLRYKPPATKASPVYMTGYGVELALKKTDYLVIDDRKVDDDDASPSELPIDAETRTRIQEHLFDEIPEIKPLTTNEIRELGLKTTQLIVESASPLSSLVQLSQDFPRYAHSIAQLDLDAAVRDEIDFNHRSVVGGGVNALWLNGLSVGAQEIDPFSLLRLIRREHQIISSLISIGFDPTSAIELLCSPLLTAASTSSDSGLEGVFDVRDDSPNGEVVLWWNDLEKDSRYARWPKGIYEILRPAYHGQLRQLGLNLYSVLFVRDMSKPSAIRHLLQELQVYIKGGYPMRFGLAPIVDEKNDDGEATLIAKLIHYYVSEFGRGQAMDFLEKLLSQLDDSQPFRLAAEHAFNSTTPSSAPKSGESAKTFEEVTAAYADYVAEVRRFLKRIGVSAAVDTNGLMFVNGKLFDFDDEGYQQSMFQEISVQTQYIAKNLYLGEISEGTNIYEHLLTRPHVAIRRNPYVFVSDARPLKVLDLTVGGSVLDALGYVQSESVEGSPLVSVWVVANFDSVEGARLGLEALLNLDNTKQTRVTLLHNPSAPSSIPLKLQDDSTLRLSDVLYRALHEDPARRVSLADLKAILETAVAPTGERPAQALLFDQTKAFGYGSPVTEIIAQGYSDGWAAIGRALANVGIEGNFAGILVNGRVVGPIPARVDFVAEDFGLLVDLELQKRIQPINNAIVSLNLTSISDSENLDPNFLLKASSILGAAAVSMVPTGIFNDGKEKTRNRMYRELHGEHIRIAVGNMSTSYYQFGAIIDPLSEFAQKTAAVLETLSKVEGVYIEIYLNPLQSLNELPLKRFYRYVFDDELHFDATGQVERPSAYFTNIPEDPLLTLGMDVISPWLIRPVVADQDLDNIRLANLDAKQSVKGITAVFELRNILIEGHGRDTSANGPPRGLQFVLGTASYPALVDTIVMANLGYLQLKANPGVFELSLREGRSKEIYDIESVGSEGWLSRSVEEIGYDVVLNTFEGVVIYPRVFRKPGKEKDNLLEDTTEDEEDTEDGGIWDSIKSSIWGSQESKKVTEKTNQAEINIFSVASGHLYERFLSIMIISVLRHTKSTVKFWFIENFLSPSFMDFIPHMAAEYNFEYELVTYKWPHWLRAQTEKQRTIWGYKILFLDVLFPLDLDKVIFVDADQIVRTDLKELVDMDLKGAPYGYTPFCDSRTEMDGFRFWTSGYWQQHLAGRPYHISALYVIDLIRFRQMAAGDRLRGQYQALSADPNSLANLDQDLPNNMIHQVPIFSLPQDWLWCETWCSDESLKTAKTIDLCNNPLTKEPKLDRARRQIPEWEEYDNEAEVLRRRVIAKKETKTASSSGVKPVVEVIEVEKVEVGENIEVEKIEITERVKDEL